MNNLVNQSNVKKILKKDFSTLVNCRLAEKINYTQTIDFTDTDTGETISLETTPLVFEINHLLTEKNSLQLMNTKLKYVLVFI